MKGMQTYGLILVLVFVSMLSGGCSVRQKVDSEQSTTGPTVVIAQQFGLAYAPVQIMQEKKLLEKYLPGVTVEWKQMGTGPVIRDAMATGQVDIGFMGISPFLIGWDKGVPWKIATACGSQPLGLVTYKEDIKHIEDFTAEDRIATPAVASIQHILLSMAAEQQLQNSKALDSIMLALTHPDAATSLLSKQDITGHFTSPPYLFQEIDTPGMHLVLSGEEAFGGEFTFIFGVATEQFYNQQPGAYAAFVTAFAEAIAYVNNYPREAAAILAPLYQMDEEATFRYLTWEGTNYTSTPYGTMAFALFMFDAGYISKMPRDISVIAFDNVQSTLGKRQGELSAIERLQWRDGENGDN